MTSFPRGFPCQKQWYIPGREDVPGKKAGFVNEYKNKDQALGLCVSRCHRDVLAADGRASKELTADSHDSPNSWSLGGQRRARCAEHGYCPSGFPSSFQLNQSPGNQELLRELRDK